MMKRNILAVIVPALLVAVLQTLQKSITKMATK